MKTSKNFTLIGNYWTKQKTKSFREKTDSSVFHLGHHPIALSQKSSETLTQSIGILFTLCHHICKFERRDNGPNRISYKTVLKLCVANTAACWQSIIFHLGIYSNNFDLLNSFNVNIYSSYILVIHFWPRKWSMIKHPFIKSCISILCSYLL